VVAARRPPLGCTRQSGARRPPGAEPRLLLAPAGAAASRISNIARGKRHPQQPGPGQRERTDADAVASGQRLAEAAAQGGMAWGDKGGAGDTSRDIIFRGAREPVSAA
jgi:hypothetical protein